MLADNKFMIILISSVITYYDVMTCCRNSSTYRRNVLFASSRWNDEPYKPQEVSKEQSLTTSESPIGRISKGMGL
jgi:hypothetical protein